MIDLNLQLGAIEKLMKLMAENEVDEISVDFINIKKSRHRMTLAPEVDPKALLEAHLATNTSNEPWLNEVGQAEADKWAAGGGM